MNSLSIYDLGNLKRSSNNTRNRNVRGVAKSTNVSRIIVNALIYYLKF